ncbi:MAG TPA: hypothetical protein DCQ64_31640 [Candidatus Rokubacteria bacterium]|nr:hypothetical protein [Candidatus Rokubacteria bacterium]
MTPTAPAAPGYSRAVAAQRCGITTRTLDRYVSSGLVSGTVQYVEGHGHMRLFTAAELDRIRAAKADHLTRQPRGLRRTLPPATETTP